MMEKSTDRLNKLESDLGIRIVVAYSLDNKVDFVYANPVEWYAGIDDENVYIHFVDTDTEYTGIEARFVFKKAAKGDRKALMFVTGKAPEEEPQPELLAEQAPGTAEHIRAELREAFLRVDSLCREVILTVPEPAPLEEEQVAETETVLKKPKLGERFRQWMDRRRKSVSDGLERLKDIRDEDV